MKEISFDREKTQILKGIALILMIIHHTVTPVLWAESGSTLYNILSHVVLSTKMCVYIFAFLVGYGFFCSKNKTVKYGIKRISLLVIPFWLMLFLIFIPSAHLSGSLNELLNNANGGGGLK